MRVGFDIGLASLRGTHIAIHDYALYNQTILNNESILFYQKSEKQVDPVLNKFRKHFELIPYDSLTDLDQLAAQNKIDRFYLIKSGEKDSYLLSSVPNLVHAVFPQKIKEKHGDIYGFVSEWLSRECSNGLIPFVPHIVNLPDSNQNLRKDLGIPTDSVVFAYYGGSDSFNLAFVQQTLSEIVHQYKKIFFIFMNIPKFLNHRQVIFLPGNTDLEYKVKFINTADAIIHARGIGETFGIACGEFSIKNKPIITYGLSPQRSHLEILRSRALIYRGPKELKRVLTEFDPKYAATQSWDCYSQKFSPQAVMKKFNSIFLDANLKPIDKNIETLTDTVSIQTKRIKKKLRSLSRKYYLYFY